MWPQMDGTGGHTKCRNQPTLTDVSDLAACQQHAIDNGHTLYSFNPTALTCFSSATCTECECDNPRTGNSADWRIYQEPGERPLPCPSARTDPTLPLPVRLLSVSIHPPSVCHPLHPLAHSLPTCA